MLISVTYMGTVTEGHAVERMMKLILSSCVAQNLSLVMSLSPF